MSSRQNGAYISELMHADPASAGLLLDAVYRGLEPAGVGRRYVRLTERIWLSGNGLQTDPGPQVVRSVRGLLWFGCWPVRVLVELVEWSPIACEVAIRPVGYAWPVQTDRYARCAAAHLEGLVSSLETVRGTGVVRAHAGAGAPFVLINGWNTAGSLQRCPPVRDLQWDDSATPAVRPLA